MTQDLLTSWLCKFDEDMVAKRRYMLILDSCTAYNIKSKLTAVNLTFLPANMTAKFQPLDHGVIATVKVKANTISKCFKWAGFVCNAETPEDDEHSDTVANEALNIDDVWSGLVGEQLFYCHRHLPRICRHRGQLAVCKEVSMDDAINTVVRGSAEVATDDDLDGKDDVDLTPEPDFSRKDALEYLTKVKAYYCTKKSLSKKSLQCLSFVEDEIVRGAVHKHHQTKTTAFFR
ncbi:hypothetical protein HPB50_013754 [Hyalomma asiaticum]|uniref:Uncharacterized protein n=1 Tax=Hyalomma asiaticum TaxID=266040 RepID=A0ACB7THD6_HYAAI|nr:hypothetical protein HPB50_013754 [Hyalomma asiaticum]